jgi:spoIIIJ-associated protein
MDWIVTTGPTVDDAVEIALDELSVSREDVEFEVVAEPKTSLFGLRRKQARVRLRVRPVAPPPKRDRRRPERNSKNRKPRNLRREDKMKTATSSRKRTAPNPDKADGSNRNRTSKRSVPKADTGRDQKSDVKPSPTGNRRKRTISAAQTPHHTKAPNIRSPQASDDDQDQVKAPTIRRTRKIDH